MSSELHEIYNSDFGSKNASRTIWNYLTRIFEERIGVVYLNLQELLVSQWATVEELRNRFYSFIARVRIYESKGTTGCFLTDTTTKHSSLSNNRLLFCIQYPLFSGMVVNVLF